MTHLFCATSGMRLMGSALTMMTAAVPFNYILCIAGQRVSLSVLALPPVTLILKPAMTELVYIA